MKVRPRNRHFRKPSFDRDKERPDRAPHRRGERPIRPPGQSQFRPTGGESRVASPDFLIGGIHPIELAIASGRVLSLFTSGEWRMASGERGRVADRHAKILGMAREKGISIREASGEQLDELFPGLHQGIVASIRPKPYTPFEELLSAVSSQLSALYLALDHLQDPQNFGAILRSAAAFGVAGVIIPKDRAVGITPAVYKASAGCVELVNVVQVANIRYALGTLKDKGVWTVALDASAPRTLPQMNTKRPLCLVIGAEGKGVSPVVLKEVDEVVRIPLAPGVESLNASAAAAVALFAACRPI